MTERKYITEFAINAYNDKFVLLEQDDFDNDALDGFLPHIYMIVAREKCVVPSQTIYCANPKIQVVVDGNKKFFDYRLIENKQKIKLTKNLSLKVDGIYFRLTTVTGDLVKEGKISALVTRWIYDGIFNPKIVRALKFEVLYVGQAFGESGERLAMDRLKEHSTLQRIYFEYMRLHPNKEVWILLNSFKKQKIMSMAQSQCSKADDDKHMQAIFEKEIPEDQLINIIEGTLIRYFQPEYNVQLKESFPCPRHSSYNECYKLDYNSVSVACTFDQSGGDFGFIIGTNASGYKRDHLISYTFHNETERKAMFDF